VSQLGGGLILVVDDQEIVRMFMDAFIRRLGYKAVIAASAEEGLICFRRHQDEITLVISDIVMPGESGLKMVQTIRAVRSDIPVLFITGTLEELPVSLKNTCGLLKKPFVIEELKARITELLSLRR